MLGHGDYTVKNQLCQNRERLRPDHGIKLRVDPIATLYMKGRPSGASLELFYDFKFATEGEPYENVLCGNGRASSKHHDCGIEWSRQDSDAISHRDWGRAG